MLTRLWNLLRHAWLDERDSERWVPAAVLARVRERITAGERRHLGQVRVVVEPALPLSYLWRHVRAGTRLDVLTRQRATMLFGRLRVWDTALNNGVLVYLLMVERRIELLADRALAERVPPDAWQSLVSRLGQALAGGQFEAGLLSAVDEVAAALERHFPAVAGQAHPNELPDAPLRL